MTLSLSTIIASLLLLCPRVSFSAAYGLQYGGHFFFNRAIGIERISNLYSEKSSIFLSGVDFKLGLGSSSDSGATIVPFVFSAQLLNFEHIDIEISQGTAITKYKESMGFATGVCLGSPLTFGKLRISPESCIMTATMLFNDLGLGVRYEF